MEKLNTPSLNEILYQMSTQQLDEMLSTELQKKPADENAVRLILRVLREREAEAEPDITPEMEAVWEQYRRDTDVLNEKRSASGRGRRRVLRVASIAAILFVIIAVLPLDAGAETFFERLIRWTEGVIEFFGSNDDEARLIEYEFKTENPGLQQVYDAVVELGVTDPVVPMWLPEGSELVECITDITPRQESVIASFSDAGSGIVLAISINAVSEAHEYYKDENLVGTHEAEGFTYRIMRNNDRWVAIWTKEKIECFISLDCPEDTLHRILGSIYVMED